MELLKTQGTVVKSGRKAETVFYKVLLSGAVSAIHGADLRHAYVALVNHHQVVFGEEVEQAVRTLPRLTAVKIARIVFYSGTVAQLLNHFQVIFHTFLDALCLDGVAHFLKKRNLFSQIILYLMDGTTGLFGCRNKEVCRIYGIFLESLQAAHGHGVHLFYAVNLVVPPGNAQHIVRIGHGNIHCIALHREATALQIKVIPDVQSVY